MSTERYLVGKRQKWIVFDSFVLDGLSFRIVKVCNTQDEAYNYVRDILLRRYDYES